MTFMTEEKVRNREWVKTAAIIFLSVMLVLTFFSNTFMNRSLPEVSTAYVTGGSINTKIRGSGTVSASEEYLVETEQSRKVETVCVRVGQTVNAGDILFILGEGDSSELEAMKLELARAELEYERAILLAGKEKYTAESEAVEEARDNLYEARETAANIKEARTEISKAEKDLAEKTAKRDELKTHLDKLEGTEDTEEVKNLKILLAEAEEKLAAWKAEEQRCKEERDRIADKESDEYRIAEENYLNAKNNVAAWQKAVDDYKAKLEALDIPGNPDPNEYNELHNQYVAAETAVQNAQAKLDEVNAKYGKYAGADYDAALEAVENAEKAYDDARKTLSTAIENGEIDEKLEDLELEYQLKEIERMRGNVAELSGSGAGNEITAKTGGTISEINISAGQTTSPGTPLAKIELSDRGYSLSISVTSEQAKKVSIGDTAEVSTYWWGSEINAVLRDIKNDAQSGGRNKFLVFELTGDIDPGMNVDISIGQRSANYDAIVPSSAVRSDSNGNFVLVITTKNSPLGNRYTATRVDVQVIAKDDINSAVSGIGYGEYVITTSSAPIESGMLVRMAEG